MVHLLDSGTTDSGTGNTWQDNMRDTLENWQSEFLQLIWQVVALTYLWYIGSPQSKEEEERNQEMLEWIMKNIDRQKAEEFMQELEQKYPKKEILTKLYDIL